VDEAQVLEQVDRILTLEREIKRAQMGLMVRIKNTLTPAQQTKLREVREQRG
jgi:Spy/CpxP family protein refolding chaperone